jgi:hypothetical protein
VATAPRHSPRCQSDLKFRLPAEYVQFLEQMNGGEGFIGENYLRVWPIEDLIQNNKNYHVDEVAPELFLFGSSGGGEAFAFGTRSSPPPIVAVPFIVICSAANRFLKERFVPDYNKRFAVPAAEPGSAFVPYVGRPLVDVLCVQEDRVVGADNCVAFGLGL